MKTVTYSIAGLFMSAIVLFSSCSKAPMTASMNNQTHSKSSVDVVSLANHAPVASTESSVIPFNMADESASVVAEAPTVNAETEKPALSQKMASRIHSKVEKIQEKMAAYSTLKADPNNIKKGEEQTNVQVMNDKVRIGLILFIVGILAGIILNAVGAWQVSVVGWIVAVIGLVFIVLGLLEM